MTRLGIIFSLPNADWLTPPRAARRRQLSRSNYGVMFAPLQTLAPTAVHSAEAEMKLSLMTVEAMFVESTHTGVSSEAG